MAPGLFFTIRNLSCQTNKQTYM